MSTFYYSITLVPETFSMALHKCNLGVCKGGGLCEEGHCERGEEYFNWDLWQCQR
jgi:hypothetical protein